MKMPFNWGKRNADRDVVESQSVEFCLSDGINYACQRNYSKY